MTSAEPANEVPSVEPAPAPAKLRQEHLLWLPALVALLLYLPTSNHGLVTDDRTLIAENPYLLGFSGLRTLWTEDLWGASSLHLEGQYYRPFAMTTYWIQMLILGPSLGWLRLGNILIHAGTAALLPRLLLRNHPKLGIPFATLVALLWAVHPMQSESVIWLSGRFDTLVVLFAVLTLFLNDHPRRALYVPLTLALALLSKEVGITLFPAVILADVTRLGGVRDALKSEGFKWFGAACVVGLYLGVRKALGIYGAADLLTGMAPTVFLSGLADLSITYAQLTLFPLHLDVHHWYSPRPVTTGAAIFITYVAVFAVALLYARKHNRGLMIAGCCSSILSLMLSSNIGPSQSVYGDRFWSFTGLALALVIAEVLENRKSTTQTHKIVPSAITLVFGLLTLLRGFEWQSEERLTRVALEREPDHPHWLLLSAHQLVRRGQLDEARETAEHLLGVKSRMADLQMAKAHNVLCVVHLRRNQLEQAERACLEATRLAPNLPSAWTNLGSVYVNGRKFEETRKTAEKALMVQPQNPEAEYLLALVHANLGAFDDARKHLKRGMSLAPQHRGLRQLEAQLAAQSLPKPAPRE